MTFSLVGRCARTGMLGAIVTTSSIAVGSRCAFVARRRRRGADPAPDRPAARPADARPAAARLHGSSRRSTPSSAATPHRDWRQLAVIDRQGRTASFSGARVKPERTEAHGRDCVALANIVRSTEVPAAMVKAFEADPAAPLASRLIDALQAGDAAGGEFKPLVRRRSWSPTGSRSRTWTCASTAMGLRSRHWRRLWQEYEPMADLLWHAPSIRIRRRRSEIRRRRLKQGGAPCDTSFSRSPRRPA